MDIGCDLDCVVVEADRSKSCSFVDCVLDGGVLQKNSNVDNEDADRATSTDDNITAAAADVVVVVVVDDDGPSLSW